MAYILHRKKKTLEVQMPVNFVTYNIQIKGLILLSLSLSEKTWVICRSAVAIFRSGSVETFREGHCDPLVQIINYQGAT